MSNITEGIEKVRRTEANRISREIANQIRVGSLNDFTSLLRKISDSINGSFSSILSKITNYKSSTDWNTFQDSLRIDLKTLYQLLDTTDSFLVAVGEKNRSFYEETRRRIALYNGRLAEFRSILSSDLEGNTFSENFFHAGGREFIGSAISHNKLIIAPVSEITFNNSWDIKNVDLTILPAEGPEAFVWHLTNLEHDLKFNYRYGEQDLFKSDSTYFGVSVVTKEVPNIKHGKKAYSGVIAYLDIEFNSPRWINRVVIEPIGKYGIQVIGLQALDAESDARYNYGIAEVFSGGNSVIVQVDQDVVELSGFRAIHTKRMRVVLYQPNADTVIFPRKDDNALSDEITFNVYSDSRFGSNGLITDVFAMDRINLLNLFYIAAYRSTGTDDLIRRAISLLFPSKIDIPDGTYYEFNIGAHSFKPQLVLIPQNAEVQFFSHNRSSVDAYRTDDGVAQIELSASYDEPGSSSVGFYIVDQENRIEIPILPSNRSDYTEVVEVAELDHSVTTLGGIYIPGKLYFSTTWPAFNSPRIYVNGVPHSGAADRMSHTKWVFSGQFNPSAIYTVTYTVDVNDIVQCWRGTTSDPVLGLDAPYLVFATRAAVLNYPSPSDPPEQAMLEPPRIPETVSFSHRLDDSIEKLIDMVVAEGFTINDLVGLFDKLGFGVDSLATFFRRANYKVDGSSYGKEFNANRFLSILRKNKFGHHKLAYTLRTLGLSTAQVEQIMGEAGIDGPSDVIKTEFTYVNMEDGFEQKVFVVLPADYVDNETNNCVVINHGIGKWEEKKTEWEPYMVHLALGGHIAAFPETRKGGENGVGITDLASIIRELKDPENGFKLYTGKFSIIGEGTGNVDGIYLIEDSIYKQDVDNYISLYGEFERDHQTDIGTITTPIFLQVGDRDKTHLKMAETFSRMLKVNNKTYGLVTYVGSRYGFFFDDQDTNQALAIADQKSWFDWRFLNYPAPTWVWTPNSPEDTTARFSPVVAFCSISEFNYWFSSDFFFDVRQGGGDAVQLPKPHIARPINPRVYRGDNFGKGINPTITPGLRYTPKTLPRRRYDIKTVPTYAGEGYTPKIVPGYNNERTNRSVVVEYNPSREV